MIVKTIVTINGKDFEKTYSDKDVKIERDGVRYDEAIDPMYSGREYIETDEPVEVVELGDSYA